MTTGIDPFTRTPGIAGAAFIDMHYADIIIRNFESELSSKYVYKIVGLRGSGKSVAYSKIIDHFRECEDWCVYTLSASGNPTQALIAALGRESFNNVKKSSTSRSIQGSAGGNGLIFGGSLSGSVTDTTEQDDNYFSPEEALSRLVENAEKNGKKVLIGIDDISKTDEMIKFLSIIGKVLMDLKGGVYLVCTGLSKNIEDFSESPSLTFFKRGDSLEVGALDRYEIAGMYCKLLNVSQKEAVKLSQFTKGYAYAYQVLGSLYFENGTEKGLNGIIDEFDRIMSRDSYDLIWKSLTEAEKKFVKNILSSKNGDVSEIKNKMETPSGYSSLRDRLIKKHILNVEERGKIRIDLPRFKEFVDLWEM